jgi:Contractile injection system tube protein
MERKTGYLASIDNVPPLIFRFQFNPDIFSEKKTYKYEEAESLGQWGFDQTKAGAAGAGSGLISKVAAVGGGLWKDVKEIGSLLVATKPLEPVAGEQRQFALEFALDASRPGPMDGDSHYNGSIQPDLAVLRSFMNPSLDIIDLTKIFVSGFKDLPCWNRPPQCTLVYAGLSVTCVMTDLNIKITAFQDDGEPLRAEVNVTLKEQTFSASPLVEFITRNINVAKSYNRKGFGTDIVEATPIRTVLNLFE